jgi:corrinoid protein of di/trimethylamine methyltransferase
MLAAIRGETADLLPYVPRIDLWYNANVLAGTLPEKHRRRRQDEISRAEGWALHKVLADLLDLRGPEDVLHRGIGVMATRHSVYRYRFSSGVDIRVQRDGDTTRIEYHTPLGMVSTTTTFPEEMKRAGSTVSIITERPIKSPGDYRILAYVFENLDVSPNDEDYTAWEQEVGEWGFCCGHATFAASPIHHIQRDFLDPTQFYYHYKDYQKEMRYLADAMEPYFNDLLRMAVRSPAMGICWGANYDDMITYPPFFEKELLPWLQKAGDALRAEGKIIYCHCDGENLGLMDLIKVARIDLAEAVCPHPMTKVPLDEYYRRWGKDITIFGGIPSNMLLSELASEDEFEAYLDYMFKAIAPGTRFIVGIADTTPPDAVFDRLVRIGERVEKEGRLPLQAGALRPISQDSLSEAAARVGPTVIMETIYGTVQQDVFNGNDEAIADHILALIHQEMKAQDILDKGLIAAMEIIGRKFKAGELFIPEVLLSSRAMNKGVSVLESFLSKGEKRTHGKVLLGTVKGDLHDIGKNMVATMLRGVGFDVCDLGVDVPVLEFLRQAEQYQPQIVGLSALLTTTMPEMRKIIEQLKKAGFKNRIKIMVGGAPVNNKYAQEIGADGYAADAAGAVELAHRLVTEKTPLSSS